MEPSQLSGSHTPKPLQLDTQSYREYPHPIAPSNTSSSPSDNGQTPVRGYPEPFSSPDKGENVMACGEVAM